MKSLKICFIIIIAAYIEKSLSKRIKNLNKNVYENELSKLSNKKGLNTGFLQTILNSEKDPDSSNKNILNEKPLDAQNIKKEQLEETKGEAKENLSNKLEIIKSNEPQKETDSKKLIGTVPRDPPKEDIPSPNPKENVSVTTPAENVPVTKPKDETLSTNPKEDVPSPNPKENVTETTPAENVPETKPKDETLSTNPKEVILLPNPKENVSVTTPADKNKNPFLNVEFLLQTIKEENKNTEQDFLNVNHPEKTDDLNKAQKNEEVKNPVEIQDKKVLKDDKSFISKLFSPIIDLFENKNEFLENKNDSSLLVKENSEKKADPKV